MGTGIPPVDTHELAKQAYEKVVKVDGQVFANRMLAEEARVEIKTELLGKYDELQKEIKGLGSMFKHVLLAKYHPKWGVRRAYTKKLREYVLAALKPVGEPDGDVQCEDPN